MQTLDAKQAYHVYEIFVHRLKLTSEQFKALEIVERGHNVLVTGQAGTEKTSLVGAMFNQLSKEGKKVEVVCASGIAGNAYSGKIRTSTAHAFYGLRTADLPSELVIERAVANNLVAERVKSVDTVIWDEISMSSRRVFELANGIHVALSPACDSSYLFGGKQVVLVGDFLQLRPVANFFDQGKFAFESPLFKCIPHRLELTTILRQNESDKEFISCLKEIRLGQCGPESLAFIRNLTRDLPEEMMDDTVHIFFKRLPVQMFNLV